MGSYTEEFKKEMVKKMLIPGGLTPYALGKKVGVSRSTLSKWKNHYVKLGTGEVINMNKKKKKLTAKEKFKLVIEYEKIKEETDKGEFLRKNGLHTADLVEWKVEMLSALDDTKVKESTKLKHKELKRIKALERELNRKEKALAESAALIFLKKKVEEYWEEKEEK